MWASLFVIGWLGFIVLSVASLINDNAANCDASELDTSATKGVIGYYQLWVDEEGITHIDEQQFRNLTEKGFSSTALQFVRSFTDRDFSLSGLVVTQQTGENPWHHCPSPQFVVTLEGSWYIRTSDGKETTFTAGDV